jgi:hypothetical protein
MAKKNRWVDVFVPHLGGYPIKQKRRLPGKFSKFMGKKIPLYEYREWKKNRQ